MFSNHCQFHFPALRASDAVGDSRTGHMVELRMPDGDGRTDRRYPTVPHYQGGSGPQVDAMKWALFHFGSPND